MRTDQELFTQAVLGMRSQNYALSQLDDAIGTCLYRHPDGYKCLVGHLIPDELYHPSIEGLSSPHLPVDVLPERDNFMLSRLQRVHDLASDSQRLVENLKEFATRHNLEFPE